MSFAAIKKEPVQEPIKKEAHQQINQDSGNFEYYTPEQFTDAARIVMGGIDLDPASSLIANERVKAKKIFTIDDNGLMQTWAGRVWMNHPFSKGEKKCYKNRSRCKKQTCKDRGYHIDIDLPGNTQWIKRIVEEYEKGAVTEAIIICYASTSETWFTPLLEYLQCFIKGRVDYYDENGNEIKGCPKGSVITYLGKNPERFKKEFCQFGVVK